jgi:hypothetical protein
VADSVGPALLAILDTLTPAERVALVLQRALAQQQVPFARSSENADEAEV